MDYTWGDMKSPWLHEDLSCWSSLITGTEKIQCKKNSFLFHDQDDATAVYVVCEGRFRITTYQEDGDEKQIYIAEIGSLFGEDSCIAGMPYNSNALAIIDSKVYRVSIAELKRRMQADTMLTSRLLEYEIRKNYLLQQQIAFLSFSPAYSRIARILLNINQLYGKKTPDGHKIEIRFTKNDIASMVGTSRVTVSSELSKMELNGLLVRQGRYYLITNLEELVRLASF